MPLRGRIASGFPLEKLLKVKETVPVEFSLVSSTRKKARERERTIEMLEVTMTLTDLVQQLKCYA